jgi:hypothetical protein
MNDKYRLVLSDDEACRRVRDFVKYSAFYVEHYRDLPIFGSAS